MAGKNGKKKSSAQLDREIASVTEKRTSLPSNAEYERRELDEAHQKLHTVENAPLAHRKEAAAELLAAMRDIPEVVGERVGWLLDGNYGYGPMRLAKRVLGNTRMNRLAALTHMIGAFEWSTPSAMAIAGWKKLTKSQQAALDRAVGAAIKSAESEA